ncbi:MAG: transglutaminase-like cysteine peptidase [Hyphomicrobiales bacterium]|nr:transglutaminase-like cysteine peptidase [Hyphomicrobiales bacterium]
MPVAGATGAPIGYVQFCRENRSECGDKTSSPGIVKLSRALWNEVVAVNAFVNGAIEPVTDEELYNTAEKWTFPKGGRGDCEDYVLLKRRLLMDRGWPASALLITVVRDENGGHAVLTVRTDQGDFILDNQESKVLAWYQTPYRYIKRQSESEAMRWVSIQDDRPFNVGSIRK